MTTIGSKKLLTIDDFDNVDDEDLKQIKDESSKPVDSTSATNQSILTPRSLGKLAGKFFKKPRKDARSKSPDPDDQFEIEDNVDDQLELNSQPRHHSMIVTAEDQQQQLYDHYYDPQNISYQNDMYTNGGRILPTQVDAFTNGGRIK